MTDLAVHYNIRRFQHFKTLFCRSLLLSNMQICYLVENIRPTRFKIVVFASFCLGEHIFTEENKLTNFYRIQFQIVGVVNPYQKSKNIKSFCKTNLAFAHPYVQEEKLNTFENITEHSNTALYIVIEYNRVQ